MPNNRFNLIKPIDLKPKPDAYEEKVAELLARHFKSDVKFVCRSGSTTPDILMVRYNQFWEIKNIKGNSKRTIQNNLRKASSQSENVVISLFRTKMTDKQVCSRAKQYFAGGNTGIKKLLIVTKTSKIIELK